MERLTRVHQHLCPEWRGHTPLYASMASQSEDPVIAMANDSASHILLNRPKALNSLNLGMVASPALPRYDLQSTHL